MGLGGVRVLSLSSVLEEETEERQSGGLSEYGLAADRVSSSVSSDSSRWNIDSV
jgi:hypothetical protein